MKVNHISHVISAFLIVTILILLFHGFQRLFTIKYCVGVLKHIVEQFQFSKDFKLNRMPIRVCYFALLHYNLQEHLSANDRNQTYLQTHPLVACECLLVVKPFTGFELFPYECRALASKELKHTKWAVLLQDTKSN